MKSVVAQLRDQLRLLRRYLKSRAPFVRRREYLLMQHRCELITDAFTYDHRLATDARLDILKPMAADDGEICLFVTHADKPRLRAHVIHHVACLVEQGFKVVLIINSDLPSDQMDIDAATVERASAVYVRENIGFDFAAWGHTYVLGKGFPNCRRLLLVNDSLVGPLSSPDYKVLVARLRASQADLIGLTENCRPAWHLQSFFLALNARVLADARFKRMFSNILAFKDKGTVITVYEFSLARQLRTMGFQCEALFPARFHDERSGDDSLGRWEGLLDDGFPFVKGAVVRNPQHAEAVAERVPAHFIESVRGG